MTMAPLASHYRLVAPSCVKVFVDILGEEPMVGTGFCIAPGLFLTCAHVVLGRSRLGEVPEEELQDWRSFHTSHIRSTILIDQNGNEHACEIVHCDTALDVALLKTSLTVPHLSPAVNDDISPGMDLVYYGYPYTIQTGPKEWPFSVFRAIVSAVTPVAIGGTERRAFAVLHGLAIGGMSGGPVFDAQTGVLCGMINGQMLWGRSDVLIAEKDENGKHKVADTDTPLPVGFVTSFSFLRGRGFNITSPSAPA